MNSAAPIASSRRPSPASSASWPSHTSSLTPSSAGSGGSSPPGRSGASAGPSPRSHGNQATPPARRGWTGAGAAGRTAVHIRSALVAIRAHATSISDPPSEISSRCRSWTSPAMSRSPLRTMLAPGGWRRIGRPRRNSTSASTPTVASRIGLPLDPDQRDRAAVEAAVDAQGQELGAGAEVDDAVVAQGEAALAGQRHGAGDRQAAQPGAVARAGVAQGEAQGARGSVHLHLDLGVAARHTGRAQDQVALRIAPDHDAGQGGQRHAVAPAQVQGDPARRDQARLQLVVQAAILGGAVGRGHAAADRLERRVAGSAAQVQLVVGERLAQLSLTRAALLVAHQRLLHQVQHAAVAVGRGRGRVVAQRLVRLAGRAVLAGLDQQRRGFAYPLAVALGGHALGLGLDQQRLSQRAHHSPALGRALLGPVQRVAQRVDLVAPAAGPAGPGQMHAHRRLAVTGQGIALGGELVVAGRLGRHRRAVVGGEQALEEAHVG